MVRGRPSPPRGSSLHLSVNPRAGGRSIRTHPLLWHQHRKELKVSIRILFPPRIPCSQLKVGLRCGLLGRAMNRRPLSSGNSTPGAASCLVRPQGHRAQRAADRGLPSEGEIGGRHAKMILETQSLNCPRIASRSRTTVDGSFARGRLSRSRMPL